MTYISIQAELEKLLKAGELVLIRPLLSGAHVRIILATALLHSQLVGPWDDDPELGRRMGLLWRDLDRFSYGQHMTIGHGEDEHCDFKPLDPEKDEIWEYRSRAPAPSWRVFGRFAEPDVFIATNMERRGLLGAKRSREWAIEIGLCKSNWRRLFPYCDPYRGEKTNDYITANVTDLRDLEKR